MEHFFPKQRITRGHSPETTINIYQSLQRDADLTCKLSFEFSGTDVCRDLCHFLKSGKNTTRLLWHLTVPTWEANKKTKPLQWMFLSAVQQWRLNLALQERELLEPDSWRQAIRCCHDGINCPRNLVAIHIKQIIISIPEIMHCLSLAE